MVGKIKTKLFVGIVITLVFAYIYYQLQGHFNQPMSWVDCLYFSTTTFTTIGVGDIYPVTDTAKLLLTLQTVCFFGGIIAY